MAASSTVVIKVKYGDMLRRFSAQVIDDKLDLNIDGLKKRILSLFSLAPDTELILTYIDEDDDVVALVDDDDLHDVMKQDINPLRITVKLNDDKNGSQYNNSTASSTPLRSPGVQHPLPNLNAGISEILSKVQDPLRETLMKLSDDLASKASSSAPSISELVDIFSKVGLSYLGKPSESQPGVKPSMSAGVPESSTSATETKNSERLENLVPEATMERNGVKSKNATGQSTKASSFDFNAVAAALDSQNGNFPNSAQLRHEFSVFPHVMRKKEKIKKLFPSVLDKSLSGKGGCNPNEPKLGSNSGIVKASDPTIGDNVNDNTRCVGKSPAPMWAPSLVASSFGGPIEAYECPFSGTAMGSISPVPPQPTCQVLCRGNASQNDGSGTIFHSGVCCDGCGVHPIIGPRFKSKVKVDYDLCSICFEDMGNSKDYIRMDRPGLIQPMYLKRLHDAGRTRQIPHVFRGHKGKLGALKLDSRFIQDVNIFDGSVMSPSTPFTKIWRMRNNGTLLWPPKTQLVWIGGDKLSNSLSVEVQIPPTGLLIDQELDIAVDFISPELPGRYISYWRMASPSGQKFGQRVWVLIQIDASLTETPRETVRNLNLNLPPVSSSLTGPEIINVEPVPMVEDSHPVVDNSKKAVESVKPDAEQELKFPINDSLLVGNGASTSVPLPSAFPSVSYPIIDLADVAPALPSLSPFILHNIPPPPPPSAPVGSVEQFPVHLSSKNQVEEELLRELEEMGFKQVDLNKEVLRMNEYDLEQAVDDLCGVAEWDPILEELQEMGFNDTEMNKKLLKKNNGSIKRVVMDLIAGEKI